MCYQNRHEHLVVSFMWYAAVKRMQNHDYVLNKYWHNYINKGRKSVGKSTFFAELEDIIRKGSANISREELHHMSKCVRPA